MDNKQILAAQKAEFEKMVKKLPAVAGVKAVRFFKANFRRQGFLNGQLEKWKKRKGDTDQGRAVLVNTGRLRRSIRVTKQTTKRVRIGTNVEYAQIHNEGGTIKANIKVRRHNRKGKPVKAHQRKVKRTIPKRQFIGDSKTLNKELQTHIENQIKIIFK